MHDENTVAFEVKRPWPTRVRLPTGSWTYWPSLITVWHVGECCLRAERYPSPSDEAEKLLREMAEWESRFPHWFTADGGEQAAKLYALWATFAWRLNFRAPWYTRLWRRRHLPRRMLGEAMWLVGNEHDHISDLFRVPEKELAVRAPAGNWDGGWKAGDPVTGSGKPAVSEQFAYDQLRRLWTLYARHVRPPFLSWRLHVHHWEVQVHPWQQLRRWLLTRCERCRRPFRGADRTVIGFGFGWGRSERPRWFRGERGCYHERCADQHRADSEAAYQREEARRTLTSRWEGTP